MRSIRFLLIIFLINITNFAGGQDLIIRSEFCFVVGDNINVRGEPEFKSKIITKLRIAKRVIILKRSGKQDKIGNFQGEWVYIDTQYLKNDGNDTYKGWVLDSFLADFSMFVRVKYFHPCIFKNSIGDYYLHLEFDNKGKYKRWEKDASTGKNNAKVGTIYQYKNVIIAKDDDEDIYNYFYLDDQGRLCYAQRDLKGNSSCAVCRD